MAAEKVTWQALDSLPMVTGARALDFRIVVTPAKAHCFTAIAKRVNGVNGVAQARVTVDRSAGVAAPSLEVDHGLRSKRGFLRENRTNDGQSDDPKQDD